MDPMRILVVTGSRAFDVDPRSRFWAKAAITGSFANHIPGLVVHGGARGPDTYANELATWLGLPRVVFGLGVSGLAVLCYPDGRARKINDAERYAFSGKDPLSRNDAMNRWAADQAARGHAVKVVGLLAPWSNSNGTAYTLVSARNHDLDAETFEAPAEAWPKSDEGA